MIRYTLNCDQGHTFESWFANSAAYDKQAKRSLIACPVCNSTKVEKAIMAPRLAGSRKRETPAETPAAAAAPEKAPVAMSAPFGPGRSRSVDVAIDGRASSAAVGVD